jgi:outer membrane protein TolC
MFRASLFLPSVLVWGLLGLGPLYAAEPLAAGPGALRLDLPQCIRRALAANPEVEEAKWDVEIRRGELMEAKAGSFPRGELTNLTGVVPDAKGNILNFNQAGVDDLGRLGPFTRFEGRIVYPLFTWGKLAAGEEAARKGVEQELVGEEAQRQKTIEAVKEHYYTLLFTRQVHDLLVDVRAGFQKALETAEERLAEGDGSVTQLDVLNLRIGLSAVAREIPRLEQGIVLTRAALLRAMGLRQDTPFKVADERLEPEKAKLRDLSYYVSSVFEKRPEWRRLVLGIEAKEQELKVASSDFKPFLFLAIPFRYGYAPGRSRQTNPFAYDDFNFLDGGPVLGLRWNLSFRDVQAKVARTRAELMKLRAQSKTASLGLPLEVSQAYLGVKEAEQRMALTAEGRKAARTLVALAVANFELGIGEAQDVFMGLGQHSEASSAYYEAVKDYNIALAKLSRVVGEEVTELSY